MRGEAMEMPKVPAFQRLLDGDVAALARAVSLLETGGPVGDALADRLRDHVGSAGVVAFTGPPGAGKSTLINAYVSELRQRGESVAVLAVDPSSPLSGGAVLGDRTRMGEHSADARVFIRSVASRGHLGGLALSIPAIVDAVDAAGWSNIVLETVGAGQSETEIAEIADVNIVLNAPGLGDDVQAIKAGILEIADILVVNKCDLPLADRTIRQLKAMLQLRRAEGRNVPILPTSAERGEGIGALADAIAARMDGARTRMADAGTSRRLPGLLRLRAEAAFHQQLHALPESDMESIVAKMTMEGLSVETATKMLTARAVAAGLHRPSLSAVANSERDHWHCGF